MASDHLETDRVYLLKSKSSAMKIVLLAPLLLLFVNNINAYRILLVFPATSYSHYALGNRLAKGLAETGHEVTIIAPRKENNPPKHYREIYIEGLVQAAEG